MRTPKCAFCGRPVLKHELVRGEGGEVFHKECVQPPTVPNSTEALALISKTVSIT